MNPWRTDGRLRIDPGCAIDRAELVWRFEPSGGPGGQHANRAHTRAVVTFDIAASPSLDETRRARLQRAFGDVVRVAADDERSQLRNRELAEQRLAAKLAGALVEPRRRRATRPTRGATERRLTDKARRGERKRERRRLDGD